MRSFSIYFFEQLAKKIRKEELPISVEPNHYNYTDVLNFIKKHGLTIVYDSKEKFMTDIMDYDISRDDAIDHLNNKEIHVSSSVNPETTSLSSTNYNYLLSQIFHSIGLMFYNGIRSGLISSEDFNLLESQVLCVTGNHYELFCRDLSLLDIKFFVFEMLLPEDIFNTTMFKHSFFKGNDLFYDLVATAKDFNMAYVDIFIRGKSLHLLD